MKDINNKPLVSVILPVYNGDKYLSEAIESVLKQTYNNFEFIIINDGSTDNSFKIIERYSKIDGRIKIISRENKGLIYSLNEGIKESQGQFIARMDADDVCLPDRFERQLDYLEKHPKVGVLGSRARLIDESSNEIGLRMVAVNNYMIKGICYFGSPFLHPTVMFNRAVILTNLYYSSEFTHAEDYELWCRLVNHIDIEFANVPEILLNYRVVSNSISRKYKDQQRHATKLIINKYFLEKKILTTMNKFDVISKMFYQNNKKYLPFQILYAIRLFFKR